MADYTKANADVYDELRSVIAQYRPMLAAAVAIEIIMRDDGEGEWRSKGQQVGATIATVPDKWQPFLTADFLLTVNQDVWSKADNNLRRALLHHEICHLKLDEASGQVRIVGHDFEDFVEVAREHGAWTVALQRLAEAMRQLPLPLHFTEPEKEAA